MKKYILFLLIAIFATQLSACGCSAERNVATTPSTKEQVSEAPAIATATTEQVSEKPVSEEPISKEPDTKENTQEQSLLPSSTDTTIEDTSIITVSDTTKKHKDYQSMVEDEFIAHLLVNYEYFEGSSFDLIRAWMNDFENEETKDEAVIVYAVKTGDYKPMNKMFNSGFTADEREIIEDMMDSDLEYLASKGLRLVTDYKIKQNNQSQSNAGQTTNQSSNQSSNQNSQSSGKTENSGTTNQNPGKTETKPTGGYTIPANTGLNVNTVKELGFNPSNTIDAEVLRVSDPKSPYYNPSSDYYIVTLDSSQNSRNDNLSTEAMEDTKTHLDQVIKDGDENIKWN